MQTIILKIDDSLIENLITFLKQLPDNKYELIDDSEFTDEDNYAYKKALKELKNNETISLDKKKKNY